MEKFNQEIELMEKNLGEDVLFKEMINDIKDEIKTYENFEGGRLYDDMMNTKVSMQLSDANGNIFQGKLKLVVGYSGENIVLVGNLEEVL